MKHDLKYSDLTEKIIGYAMKVHNQIGPGFPEIIYKRCLVIELEQNQITYLQENSREIFYAGKIVGTRRLDLLIDGKALIELKACSEIEKFHHNQVINYLKVFNIEVGLLFNFGNDSLQFKRFVNSSRI